MGFVLFGAALCGTIIGVVMERVRRPPPPPPPRPVSERRMSRLWVIDGENEK